MIPGKKDDISKRLESIEATLKKIEEKLVGIEDVEEKGTTIGKGMEEGVARGVLESFGEVFPQLGKLLESVKDSPAFEERLEEIDLEIESRFKGAGLPSGRGIGSIPPSVRGGSGTPTARRGSFRRGTKREARVGADALKTIPADVFDEGDLLKVIAELPGCEEKDIEVKLEGSALVIDASSERGKRHSRVELPRTVEEQQDTDFRNGVLQVLLKKK